MKYLWLFLPLTLWSQCESYTVRFSVFGTIGTVKVCYAERDGAYVMDVDGKTAGVAAMLSKNRREHMVSQGRIKRGRHVPDVFVYDFRNNDKTRFTGYYFDHRRKAVHGETILLAYDTQKYFDALSLSFKTKTSDTFSVRPRHHAYLNEDVITLFLNKELYAGKHSVALGLGRSMEHFGIVRLSDPEIREHERRLDRPVHACYRFRVMEKDAATDVCLDDNFFPVGVVIKNILILGSIVVVRDRAKSPKK